MSVTFSPKWGEAVLVSRTASAVLRRRVIGGVCVGVE
jgi:hypothetical protein